MPGDGVAEQGLAATAGADFEADGVLLNAVSDERMGLSGLGESS